MLRLVRIGADQPGVGRESYQFAGDLTAQADGRLVLLTPAGEAHDLADVLAALVGEEPDARGDRHIGRVHLALEVVDRHQGLGRAGVYFRPREPR